jgi:hypothetical protein
MRFTVLGAIVLSTLFVPGTVRAYVSGIGGFCEHNQFYNPRSGARQRRTAH